uniref:Peptidase A1 domain-containing protein n=1 Tax=Caenorhabditis tropicalis TaxID=1561998 RepID=A0A1I7TU69_9PELO
MKFELLFLFLLFTPIAHGKLSKEENQKRVDTCGKNTPSIWALLYSQYKYLAIPISPRHVFLLSPIGGEPTLHPWSDGNHIWEENVKVDTGCKNGSLHVEVPSIFYSHLKLFPLKRFNDTGYTPFQPTMALLLHFCDTENTFKNHALVLEFEKEFDVDFPCLPKEDGVKIGDALNATVVTDEGTLANWPLEVSELDEKELVMKERGGYPRANLFGVPLFHEMNKKWTFVGLSYELSKIRFFRMSQYQDIFCEWAGICDTPVSTTTTTPIPIESKPTTAVANTEKNENGKKRNGIEFILLLVSLFL